MTTVPDNSRLLPVSQAAVALGVARRTMYEWIKQGKIPYVRLPSGTLRIAENEVAETLRRADRPALSFHYEATGRYRKEAAQKKRRA